MDLQLRVSRGADNRLSGTVRVMSGSDVRAFSGTLELMGVFDAFVPAWLSATGSGDSDREQDMPTTTSPPAQE